MAGFRRGVPRAAIGAAFAVVMAFAPASSTDAQWLLPFGAAPPAEIVQRLRAEGYVLAGPLERRDTVYLADVTHGPRGRERLVIDAWSGEILQRFLVRRRGFVPEGGEFSEPPPLGPPPARDFGERSFDYGPPRSFEGSRPKARQKPAATARRTGEPEPTTPLAQPQNSGGGSEAAVPTTAAPASKPATAAAPSAPAANPAPAAEPGKETQLRPEAAPSPAPAAKEVATPPRPSPSAQKPGEKGEKKVNDVPVNPLD
jgi:hypothetical protein